jgi:hypothetical protein
MKKTYNTAKKINSAVRTARAMRELATCVGTLAGAATGHYLARDKSEAANQGYALGGALIGTIVGRVIGTRMATNKLKNTAVEMFVNEFNF